MYCWPTVPSKVSEADNTTADDTTASPELLIPTTPNYEPAVNSISFAEGVDELSLEQIELLNALLEEEIKYIKHLNETDKDLFIDMLDCDYESEKFYEAVKGLEREPEGGARCPICFKLRVA